MNRLLPAFVRSHAMRYTVLGALLPLVCLINLPTLFSADSRSRGISIEFFWAKDCPHCEVVKDLVQLLQRDYNIKVHSVDVDAESGYKSFISVGEQFHKTPPAVPLIVVGNDVLMGEAEIKANLEKKVDSLVHSRQTSTRNPGARKTRSALPPNKEAAKEPQQPFRDSDAQSGKMRVTTDE